jgi:hypothetical protein
MILLCREDKLQRAFASLDTDSSPRAVLGYGHARNAHSFGVARELVARSLAATSRPLTKPLRTALAGTLRSVLSRPSLEGLLRLAEYSDNSRIIT